MKCIFCKSDASSSRSVEHIIPESLGNTKHILQRGIVCDKCNNYFSREVEKPFLESDSVRLLRFEQDISSKRGRIPPIDAMLVPRMPVAVVKIPGDGFAAHMFCEPNALNHILGNNGGTLLFRKSYDFPVDVKLSRMMAKMAIEVMALRLYGHAGGIDYLADEVQLDQIRNHARRGGRINWPISVRRIYDADQKWVDQDGKYVQLVNEFDILATEWSEWFFVVSLFGLEMAINYGGPDITGYYRWLEENRNISPLYRGANALASLVKVGT